jgi:hypothetical protein
MISALLEKGNFNKLLGYCAEIWALVALLSVPVGNQAPAQQSILSSEKS